MLNVAFFGWLDKVEAHLACQNKAVHLDDDPTLTMYELRAWFDADRDALDVAREIVERVKRS